jgi:hypothetical protein
MKRKANVPAEASKSTLGRNVNVHEVHGRRKRGEPSSTTSTSGSLNATEQVAWQEAAETEAKKIREGLRLTLSSSNLTKFCGRPFNFVAEIAQRNSTTAG